MSQTEETTEGAGDRQCPGSPDQTIQNNPYIENLLLRQRSRELVAQSRRIIDEIEDILLFDIKAAKQWRDARRGVSWS
jgi:hypothetical protein